MRIPGWWLLCLFLSAALMFPSGCGGGSGAADAFFDGTQTDGGDDAPRLVDAVPGGDAGDLSADTAADLQPDDMSSADQPRTYYYRAIGGVSMGATALRLHVKHPGVFDMVAALGGYVNGPYLLGMMSRLMIGGFCDLETILDNLDEINDPGSEALKCGPGKAVSPWEYPTDFNHWHADSSGGNFHRSFYYESIDGLLMALGNSFLYNPDHPYLPPGVPIEWIQPGDGAAKCANPIKVGKPHSYNAEYNPDGDYDLVTFCDGTPEIPGGKDNPDYWELAGNYDPACEYKTPVSGLLAVDINGNGRRDYHEPIALNTMERYEDWGVDGCFDADEDGQGGCTGGGNGADPNGDNLVIPDHSLGTEGDGMRQPEEPFLDYGLDGVEGTSDFGEGDGQFTLHPRYAAALEDGPMAWFDHADVADLNAADLFMDGGIRDSLHAGVSTQHLAAHLEARGVDIRLYGDYTGGPEAMVPTGAPIDLTNLLDDGLDLSPEAIGQHYMVAYGDLDASSEEIAKGDGKHVGTTVQVINRMAAYVMATLMRWPGLDWTPCQKFASSIQQTTFYSPAMDNRVTYAYAVPPCYDEPENKGLRYPLVIYLPGHGMDALDSSAVAVLFNMLAMSGKLPKMVFVVPEGSCCQVNLEDGQRYCTCKDHPTDGSLKLCVDPTCVGPEESCDLIEVPEYGLKEECNEGHFFINHASDKWGNLENAKRMKYGEIVFELLDVLETRFRLLEPAEYP